MTPCNRPGCAGAVLDTGFCDTCRRRPPAAAAPVETSGRTGPSRGSSPQQRSFTSTSNVGGLVSLPVLTLNDPSGLVLTTGTALDEDFRRCSECGAQVGRSYRGQAGLPDGHCQNCGARYSFSLKLREGDLVHDRYEIRGPLARGGLGWVYLAHDLHLDQPVVLKGLINSEDERARELATNERIALTTLDHPNLVRIHDFVHHPDPITGKPIDYIVMEYVGGPALSQLMSGSSWRAEHGALTPEHVITYVLEILSALDYLHGMGLLYCDMKPANVIRGADRLKVIDFGAVRAIGDRTSDSVGTPGYRVSDEEIAEHGLTVRSDLHTVGKTLRVLYEATDEARVRPEPVARRSLRHICERAMDDDHHRRFGTAAEMAEQLTGVLREIVALRGGERRPSRSTVFHEPATLLDAGLGAVPSLSRWTHRAPTADDPPADGRPSPRAVALGLPVPSVRTGDDGAAYLATLSVTDPQALAELLDKPATPQSVEIHLLACRTMIELSDLDSATARLARAVPLLGHRESADWRFAWHRGLIDLARGDVAAARQRFEAVYRDLPGEDAPKLASGFCAEHGGDRSEAESFYEAVWERERLQAGAAFGLARLRLSRGRAAAVAVLDQVGENSRHFEAARIAAIMVLAGRHAPEPAGLPTSADLDDAVARLGALKSLDGGERHGPLRARLIAVLREAAWGLARDGEPVRVRGGEVLGDAPSERALRTLLAGSFRGLAEQAHDRQEHGVLVDRANTVRPHTWW